MAALKKLEEYNEKDNLDIIIIARGGGSFEDLIRLTLKLKSHGEATKWLFDKGINPSEDSFEKRCCNGALSA